MSDLADLDVAVEMVRTLQTRRKEAALVTRGDRLSAPGCARGCLVCLRRCATLGIALDWWERELASLQGAATADVTVH